MDLAGMKANYKSNLFTLLLNAVTASELVEFVLVTSQIDSYLHFKDSNVNTQIFVLSKCEWSEIMQ